MILFKTVKETLSGIKLSGKGSPRPGISYCAMHYWPWKGRQKLPRLTGSQRMALRLVIALLNDSEYTPLHIGPRKTGRNRGV